MQYRIGFLAAVLASFAFFALPSQAAEKAMSSQNLRMSECNTQATGKKGDERKAFMSTCLKGDKAPAPTQQEKMKTCNADATAGNLKGDERKTFMSTCLRSSTGHVAH